MVPNEKSKCEKICSSSKRREERGRVAVVPVNDQSNGLAGREIRGHHIDLPNKFSDDFLRLISTTITIHNDNAVLPRLRSVQPCRRPGP